MCGLFHARLPTRHSPAAAYNTLVGLRVRRNAVQNQQPLQEQAEPRTSVGTDVSQWPLLEQAYASNLCLRRPKAESQRVKPQASNLHGSRPERPLELQSGPWSAELPLGTLSDFWGDWNHGSDCIIRNNHLSLEPTGT